MNVARVRGTDGVGTRPCAALAFQYTRLKARGVVIWGSTLGLYSAALVASYTTFSGSAEQMNQLLEAHSRGMLEAFGITELAGVENCMNSQVFLLAPLAPPSSPLCSLRSTSSTPLARSPKTSKPSSGSLPSAMRIRHRRRPRLVELRRPYPGRLPTGRAGDARLSPPRHIHVAFGALRSSASGRQAGNGGVL